MSELREKDIRSITQERARDLILEKQRGTIILPTGYGKTRVGLLTAEAIGGKTLVISSRKSICAQWEKALKGVVEADVFTYNTGSKLQVEVDLLILDEGHRSLSPAFSGVYSNIKYKHLLVLTATPPRDEARLKLLYSHAPLLLQVSMEEAMDQEAIANVDIYNVGIKSMGTGGGRYKLFDAKLKEAAIKLSLMCRKGKCRGDNPFEIARNHQGDREGDVGKWARQFWSAMVMRKQAVYDNDAKIPVILSILKLIPNRKWIIFFKSISMAERVSKLIPGSALYHSKMKEKDRQAVLKSVEENKSKILIGVSALNEGLDIPDLDAALCVAGVSTPLEFIQQAGRVARKRGDKSALMINLFTLASVEERWVKEKSKDFKTQNLSYEKFVELLDTGKYVNA